MGHNNIESVPENLFFNVVSIYVFNLINNPLNNIEAEPLLGLPVVHIKTSKYQICCVISPEVICDATKPWSFSCFELLPTHTFKVAFFCVSCCIIVINIFSFIWNVAKLYKQRLSQRTRGTIAGPYNIIICFLCAGHTLLGIYILVIWVSDQYVGEFFVLKENQWINSFFCSSAHTLSLFFCLNIPLIHLFLSLSRLMVVKSPFESKFKSAFFVSKIMVILTVFLLIFTVSTNVIFKLYVGVPSRTCLPLVDVDNPEFSKAVMLIVAAIQLTTVSLSVIMNYLTVQYIKETKQRVGDTSVSPTTILQLILLALSHVLCWLPSSTIFLSVLFLGRPSMTLLLHTVVFILPLNSLTNPVVFAVFAIAQK